MLDKFTFLNTDEIELEIDGKILNINVLDDTSFILLKRNLVEIMKKKKNFVNSYSNPYSFIK
jgi:hypothetical protein